MAADLSWTSTNQHAQLAIEAFNRDGDLTDEFHALLDGKWNQYVSLYPL